ncbi:DUF2125 domain-containing protein [uncultured Maricaulis sp.]|uniref:DUF2125 domain-containing protein n=1 Tax=uncultured Maricaulis sp. TaxID=174710 RepID=UPI0030DB3C61
MSIPKRFLFPVLGILILLVLYTAYWLHAKSTIEREVGVWIARQESAGYLIEEERIRVTGYPYRFQVELTAPQIHAPQSDGGWNARMEILKAHALFYDFRHWILEFDGPVWLEYGSETPTILEIDAELALVSLASNDRGETIRIGAEFSTVQIVTRSGQAPGLEAVESLLFSGAVAEDDTLRLRLEARNLAASEAVLAPEIGRAFGRSADLARMDLTVTQWATLAIDADAAAWSRAGGQLLIAESALEWGPAHLSGVGEFTLDATAQPDGRLSLHITDPDALAEALVLSRLVPAENEQALRLAAMMAPRGPDGVALPFRIRDGGVYLGPVRLGDLEN